MTTTLDIAKTHAYIVGGGIAGLASAAYLIREGHLPGKNVHVSAKAQSSACALRR